MLHLIENQPKDTIHPLMIENHMMRYDVFYEGLGWPLDVENGLEKDEYDTASAKHILSVCEGKVVGGMRFVPTTGAYMIKEHFSQSVYRPDRLPNDSKTWEITRLYYKALSSESKVGVDSGRRAAELYIGIMEFGISLGLERFIAFTGVGIEHLFNSIGWLIERLGDVEEYHGKKYVVAYFPVSKELLWQIREKTNTDYPLFETPLSVDVNPSGDLKVGA